MSHAACVVQSVYTIEQETECDAAVNNFVLLCNMDFLHNLKKKSCHFTSSDSPLKREDMIKVITDFT